MSRPTQPAGRPLRTALLGARRPLAGLLALAGVAVLTACSPTVSLSAAPDAKNSACADVIVHLPDTAGDAAARETNAQGTAAWGDPASVLLHCGVEIPGPSTACINLASPGGSEVGIDWIRDDTAADDEIFTFTTFGRDPAVQVTVDQGGSDAVSGTSALIDIGAAVERIPATKRCTDPSDTLDLSTTPTQ